MKNTRPRSQISGSAPVLLVKDVTASAEYYRDTLGFQVNGLWGTPPGFGILERDGFCLMLSCVDETEAIRPNRKVVNGMWDVYFWVNDAEAVFAELQSRGATIDYPLCDQPYGCREFAIHDLDGYGVGFGQDLGQVDDK